MNIEIATKNLKSKEGRGARSTFVIGTAGEWKGITQIKTQTSQSGSIAEVVVFMMILRLEVLRNDSVTASLDGIKVRQLFGTGLLSVLAGCIFNYVSN